MWFSRIAVLSACFIVFWLSPGCDDGSSGPSGNDPAGGVTGVSGCKGTLSSLPDSRSTEACVRWQYDAERKLLTLKHENAGFNCCAEKIDARIRVEGGAIRIDEWESSAPCDCSCLYDLTITVRDVDAASYAVHITEPYRSGDDPELHFTVDFGEEAAGVVCVPRTHYPWGM